MPIFRFAVVAYWLALTAGLLWPGAGHLSGLTEPAIGDRPDLAHFLAFAVLGLGVCSAWPDASRVHVAGGLLFYGLATEIAQFLSPGRTPSVGGALANVLGIAAAFGIAWAARRVSQRRRTEKTRHDSACPVCEPE